MTKSDSDLVLEATARVRGKLRVTKVVVTRSVKGSRGDTYVGFSAAWDTVQDDAGGHGSDLLSAQDGEPPQGMTLKEAKLASALLGMQVDCAAHENAMAGGNLTPAQCAEATRAIKHNYTRMLLDMLHLSGKVPADD